MIKRKRRLVIRIDPTWQVGASTDDTHRRLTSSSWNIIYGRAQAGAHSASYKQYGCGMRFTNITIPQGATIDQAYLTLKCVISITGTVVNTRISAEDVDDAPTFADNAAAFDARWAARTTARVDWDAIPAWTANVDYDSPEIKTVIQEIVDREGWNSGQDIVIFWEDFEDRSTKADYCYRPCYSYDGSIAYAPKLVIEYTVPGVTHYLAGVISGVASVSGVALITRGLAGLSAGVCSAVADLTNIKWLSGVIAGVASTAGSLTVRGIQWLAGVSSGVAGVSGATAIARKLAGVSSGVCSAVADLTNIKWLSGLSAGVCSAIGTLPIIRKLAGVVSGVCAVSGSATIAYTRWLAGVSAGVCSVTGSLQNIKWLKGLIAGVATVTGSLFHVRRAIRTLAAVRNLPAVRNIPPVR